MLTLEEKHFIYPTESKPNANTRTNILYLSYRDIFCYQYSAEHHEKEEDAKEHLDCEAGQGMLVLGGV